MRVNLRLNSKFALGVAKAPAAERRFASRTTGASIRDSWVSSDQNSVVEDPAECSGVKRSGTQIYASGGSRLLLPMLSVIAGSADATCFLALGLFSAHVTGNLVLLTAHIVTGRADNACLILSVPFFILIIGLTRLLVAGLEVVNYNSLRVLLLLQFLMLSGSFVLCITSGHNRNPESGGILIAGQLSVAAMAVQNGLGLIVFPRAPATAVMTTNITRLIMDTGEALLGHDPVEMAEARRRANETWQVIIGFMAGAGLGAACFAIVGTKSLGLPAGLALLALVMSLDARLLSRN